MESRERILMAVQHDYRVSHRDRVGPFEIGECPACGDWALIVTLGIVGRLQVELYVHEANKEKVDHEWYPNEMCYATYQIERDTCYRKPEGEPRFASLPSQRRASPA